RRPDVRPPRLSVLMASVAVASALSAGVERMPAPAGGRGIGVLDGEAAAHEVFLVVDLGALEVAEAHGVDDDLHALLLEDLVAVGGLVEHHAVGEAGATPALHVDAQSALGDVLLLLLQDALDLGRSVRSQVDHRDSPHRLCGRVPGSPGRPNTLILPHSGLFGEACAPVPGGCGKPHYN